MVVQDHYQFNVLLFGVSTTLTLTKLLLVVAMHLQK